MRSEKILISQFEQLYCNSLSQSIAAHSIRPTVAYLPISSDFRKQKIPHHYRGDPFSKQLIITFDLLVITN